MSMFFLYAIARATLYIYEHGQDSWLPKHILGATIFLKVSAEPSEKDDKTSG